MCRQSSQGQVRVHPNSVGIDGRWVRGARDGGADGAGRAAVVGLA
jgi:hypothetical protein